MSWEIAVVAAVSVLTFFWDQVDAVADHLHVDGNVLALRPTWHSWWMYFWQGIDRRPHTMTEVRDALMEFHSIVGSYTNQCVTPIFELPPNLRAEVPAEAKSSLDSFQQRYEGFLGEYSQFAKPLSESRPALNGLPCWFGTSKPLS